MMIMMRLVSEGLISRDELLFCIFRRLGLATISLSLKVFLGAILRAIWSSVLFFLFLSFSDCSPKRKRSN